MLLIIFTRTDGTHAQAEATEYSSYAGYRTVPNEPLAGPPSDAASAPAVTNEPDEKRIRTIARNLLTPEGKVNPHAIAALQSLGPDVIPIILHRFTGEETPEQEALLSVLEAFSEPAVAHHLMSVLPSTQSKAMARKIGGAIHTLGDVQCCERLAELAGDNNEAARLAAAIALRTCPADTSAATLVRQLNEDSSSECRIEALEGLAPASEAFANEAIRLTLQDKVPDVRLAAVKMITRRRAVNFQEDLKRLARSDSSPHVRKASSQALVELRLKTPASEEDAQ